MHTIHIITILNKCIYIYIKKMPENISGVEVKNTRIKSIWQNIYPLNVMLNIYRFDSMMVCFVLLKFNQSKL